MKHFAGLLGLAALLAQSASAHYIFSKLVLPDGQVSQDWEYIRETTRSTNYMPTKFTKTFDNLTPNDADFRCNLGSFGNAGKTKVAEVKAGDTLGMKLFYNAQIQHPGPGQVFMSKAPTGNVKEYQGDGEWFKIYEKTLCNKGGDLTKNAWCTWDMPQLEFQIPSDTPPGEYLVRAEHIGLHGAQVNEAEFFYSCAQVKVTGNGNGAPSKTYKIPGLYNDNMTLFNGLNLWVDSAEKIEADIAQTPIGDEPWTGGGNSGTNSQVVGSSDSTASSSTSSSESSSSASSAPAAPSESSSSSGYGYPSGGNGWQPSCGGPWGHSAKFRASM